MNQIALVFLCRKPTDILIDFIKTLKKDNYDIYLTIDDNSFKIDQIEMQNNNINILMMDDNECKKAGFYGSTNIGIAMNKSISWDKALYYFCTVNTQYDHVWLIEDDVFIPTKDIISNIF